MFYVLPVTKVDLLDLTDGGFNRLKFLLGLNEEKQGNNVYVNVNYLIENSELDNVSHFALRLFCAHSEEFSDFFLKAETLFFKFRVEGIDGSTAFEALQCFKEDLELIIDDRRLEKLREFHMCAIEMCKFMEEDMLKHVFHETHHKNCRKYLINVHFSYCAELVSKREVDLKDGFCIVHCGAWKKLLCCIFNYRLRHLVEDSKHFVNTRSKELDGRMNTIFQPLIQLFRSGKKEDYLARGKLLSSQVDEEAELFPPCAQNTFMHLRKNHRLRHINRFQLTLFLKDIGMDVNEAMIFWKEEYSQKFEGQSMNAERDLWNQKRKQYTYNIRHTYGMEGARKQYTSYSCSKIQSQNKTLEGGCPFQTMSKRELVKFLNNTYSVRDSQDIPPIEDILDYVSLGKPSEACMTCFNAHKKKILNQKNVSSIFQDKVKTNEELVNSNLSIDNSGYVFETENFKLDSMSEAVVMSAGSSGCNESTEKKCDTNLEIDNPIQYYLALRNLQ